MSNMICHVSGIDANPDARDVFVWCHDKVTGTNRLVVAGRVVGSGGGYVPPGVFKGQFRFTFILPGQYSTEDIRVTADKNGTRLLSNVTVETPCLAPAASLAEGPVTVSGLAVGAVGPSRFVKSGQIMLIHNAESVK
jgi:hypothetical protein